MRVRSHSLAGHALRTGLLLGLALIAATETWAKARFALRDEMLDESDIIAIVDVTHIEKLEPEKDCGNARATAMARQYLRGDAGPGKITFMAPCFFPCAVAKIAKGPQIVFLKKNGDSKDRWIASNWQYSYRPIMGDAIDWFRQGHTLDLAKTPLETVVAEISEILSAQGVLCPHKPSIPTKPRLESYSEIKDAFVNCEYATIDRLRRDGIEDLTEAQRNELALIAAKRLETTLASIAADFIHTLSEKRLITDPRILPHLIRALDHPNRHSVAQKLFYALGFLTGHHSGRAYWGRMVDDPGTHDKVVDWWRQWWKANKDKHPIFDSELEERLKAETMKVSRTIETQVKPKFAQLVAFRTPEVRHRVVPSPVFNIIYDTAMMSMPWPNKVPQNSRETWLHIHGGFLTKDLPPEIDAWAYQMAQPERKTALHVREVFSKNLEGTDLAVRVRLATKNEALVQAIQEALQRESK